MREVFQYNADGDLLFDGKKLAFSTNSDSRSVYVYSRNLIQQRIELYKSALSGFKNQIHYAVKANANHEVLQLIAKSGLGADVVSGGELKIALQHFSPDEILFSGTGKTKQELKLALEYSIKQINVESLPELERLCELAKSLGKTTKIGLRINPSVDANTHPYISTGFKDNKFGIDESDLASCYSLLKANPQVKLNSLTCHIGSQLLDFSAFQEALHKLRRLCEEAQGQGFPLQGIDIGGGVGIFYDQDAKKDEENFKKYIEILSKELQGFQGQIMAEPGRFIVGRAGVLLTEVQYVKQTPYKTFVICGSGMNHLIRPALYQAKHRVFPLKKRDHEMLVDVVGPVCESSDFLAKNIQITSVVSGDWLAIADSGAYGFSMATPYNAFDFPLETVL